MDLLSGPAVPLRAYLESWLLTYYTGDLDVVYPGFQRVTPPLVQFQSSDWRALPYARRAVSGHQGSSDFNEPGLQILGNEDLHILKLESVPSGYRAFVCDSRFGMYKHTEGASNFSPLRAESSVGAMVDIGNMSVWRVEFTAGSQPLAGQEGPLPAPVTTSSDSRSSRVSSGSNPGGTLTIPA